MDAAFFAPLARIDDMAHRVERITENTAEAFYHADGTLDWDAQVGGMTLLSMAAVEVAIAVGEAGQEHRSIYEVLCDDGDELLLMLMAVDPDLREAMAIAAEWIIEEACNRAVFHGLFGRVH
jgi:hypothetical protein